MDLPPRKRRRVSYTLLAMTTAYLAEYAVTQGAIATDSQLAQALQIQVRTASRYKRRAMVAMLQGLAVGQAKCGNAEIRHDLVVALKSTNGTPAIRGPLAIRQALINSPLSLTLYQTFGAIPSSPT